VERTYVIARGYQLDYFGGCDYYRLTSHPAILSSVEAGLRDFGLNVAASRKTTGNHPLYEELEEEAARFFGAQRAILTSSGYLTNIATAQGLKGTIDFALIDDHAHSSLKDAALFLGCRAAEFTRGNLAQLGKLAKKAANANARIALLTDGVFANDGSVAPLAAYRKVLGRAPLLWVDDSHGAGILGRQGRGSVELEKIGRKNLIQTVTFSKAIGAYGGVILCERAQAARIAANSAALTGNTPIPLPIANAALTGLRILREDFQGPADFSRRLKENVRAFWKILGVRPPATLVPIIAICSKRPLTLKRKLLKAGVYPSLICYPGGPAAGYFRFAISSEHSPEQIARLAKTLRDECRVDAL
jgi:7-keto-8-aminopelargonate synthetase-like enzyme